MCTGLGLLAHLDGSHVRLLAFSSRHMGSGEPSDGGASGGIVADIDLDAGRRSQNPDDKRGEGTSSLRKEGAVGPALETTSQGPARGLSWGRCSHSADSVGAASVASGDSSVVVRGPQGATGGGVGVGGVHGGRSGPEIGGGGGRGDLSPFSDCSSVFGDQGGEVACHIAVACGSEVLLWKVSRVSCDARIGSSTQEGDIGNKPEIRYRYATVSVLTDWHRGGRDHDSSTERKTTPVPSGNTRCASFRPCGGGSAGLSVPAGVVGGGGTVPLAAWYDAGAAVLG